MALFEARLPARAGRHMKIGGILLVFFVFFASVGQARAGAADRKKGRSFDLRGSETRPVLDPSLFKGLAAAAYAAAKQYPKVLNEVFCYCSCDEPPVNHVTLLSCYTDLHAEG